MPITFQGYPPNEEFLLCACPRPASRAATTRVPAGRAAIRLQRIFASGPRAALVIATASRHRLAKFPARCRERANIVQVSSLSPPPPLYPSFALLRTRIYYGRWRRFCLPSAKYSPSPHGRGFFISSLRLRLTLWQLPSGEGIVTSPPCPRYPMILFDL